MRPGSPTELGAVGAAHRHCSPPMSTAPRCRLAPPPARLPSTARLVRHTLALPSTGAGSLQTGNGSADPLRAPTVFLPGPGPTGVRVAGCSVGTVRNHRVTAEHHVIAPLGARRLRDLSADDVDRWSRGGGSGQHADAAADVRDGGDTKREGLGRVPGPTELVFVPTAGTALDAHDVRRSFRRVVEKAGLDAKTWTPRELRHSSVSLLSTPASAGARITTGRPRRWTRSSRSAPRDGHPVRHSPGSEKGRRRRRHPF
jgi:hypothetical protein